MTLKMKLEVGARSEAGSAHPFEDRMLVDEGSGLFAVADGVTISSRGSGAVAAELALGLLHDAPKTGLMSAIERVNQLSFERRRSDDKIGETTLTAALVGSNSLSCSCLGV